MPEEQAKEKIEKKFPEDYYGIDRESMYSSIRDFPLQLREAYNNSEWIRLRNENPARIIIVGMGGSGIGAELLRDYTKDSRIIPIHGYDLGKVSNEDLVVIISYSGNTEEAISCFKQARNADAETIVITSDGRLKRLAKEYRSKVIDVKPGLQPRAALGYLFTPLLIIAHRAGLINDPSRELEQAIDVLIRRDLKQSAIDLSEKLMNRKVVIYGSPLMKSVAYRWKTQLNENAKHAAFYHYLSEVNHNELEAFSDMRDMFMIILSSSLESHRIRKRVELTKKYASRYMPVIVLNSTDPLLIGMLSMIHLGDWVSYYLALRKGIDPSPVKIIEEFKKELGPYI